MVDAVAARGRRLGRARAVAPAGRLCLQLATQRNGQRGRLNAGRTPHPAGHSHDVVPAEAAITWVHALLGLDWKQTEPAAFAAVHLARVTDDRTRDLPLALREQIVTRLAAIHAPPGWIAMVQQKVELDEATERRVLGESLPPGLKLVA